MIYSGHLLTDQQILRSAFEPLNGENIHVHLVCAQKQSDWKKHEACAKSNTTQAPGTASTNVTGGGNQSSSRPVAGSAVPDVNQGMPFANHPLLIPGMFPMFGTVPGVVAPVMWTPEQMAQMQQMYTQFLAQYNLQPNSTLAPMPIVSPQIFNANIPANEPLDAPQVAPVAAAVPPAAPIRLEEPEEEDAENGDWLDVFYWFSRAVVLFSVVYFYSSFTRFVLVVGIAILMYLHQIGFIFPRNNRQAPIRRPDQAARVQQEAVPDNEADLLNNPPVSPATSDPERCSGLRLFWVIVSSLFTSLIPETQAPANFN